MTIRELANACGVGVETIRHYERRGLIPDPRPGKTGYREFSDDDARRVHFVKQAQGLGFTLKEISELLALRVPRETSCNDVRDLAEAKLVDIEEKLLTLRSFKRALGKLLDQCGQSGPKGHCPIFDALDEGQEEHQEQARGEAVMTLATGTRTDCPDCQRRGKRVKATTIESLVKPDALGRLEHHEGWRFCSAPECDTAYFHELTPARVPKDDVQVRIGQKETSAPRTVCYCFDHTVEEIEAEVAATGASTVGDAITEHCRKGLDRCPRGAAASATFDPRRRLQPR